MQSLAKDSPLAKSHYPSRFITILILSSSSFCIIYLLISIFLVGISKVAHVGSSLEDFNAPTNLGHVVFGIASNQKSWPKRKEYVKLWWNPQQMRGCVFLEDMPQDDANDTTSSLPPVCISEDTSRFRYTFRNGLRSAIRVARVVSETVKLNHSDVRWYVFGDDDTVFFTENLVKTLSKYDHGLWYYIGSNSENLEQNRYFSFEMAFGGAGFAISYPLAKVLAKVFDSCTERYPHLYGSDSRISSCLAELGVGLTREPGFHQVDLRGNMFGLLTSHPLSPLVSLHHFDDLDPIFPNMTTINSLEHLFKAVTVDSQRVLQKTVCYDRWFSWTISVAWGYAVEIYGKHIFLPDTLPVQVTFQKWIKKGSLLAGAYTFNVKEPHPDPCQRPTIFFLDHVSSSRDGITTHYKKSYTNCSYDKASPRKLEEIKVFSHKLDLSDKQLWSPRRQCCDVLRSSGSKTMEIGIRECKEEELIHMHP
ncbi:uncharacterized protein LOC8277701 [Ricinus communis]|uniref:Transferase, transferring glycosyl groups, putative n=1 Tax=Ricinus communis TaxID=3988 RepID=B9RPQ0_RICCO|nr:uncharacterized protein LOC8277701 [Ricinus communis]XP_015572693.1 uncharacterized protein LOC8277701 [Ricinus communis]EEF46666.1 transferase, transferring glycosyl groups, putative [Ricinus communis]|eukprot:XP_002515719.1 uncharacterized protein LOC8277701 [Ricinus communis]